MAIRELFAKYTFAWDRSSLAGMRTAVSAAERRVHGLAEGFDRASHRARAARGALGAWATLARQSGSSVASLGAAVRGLGANVKAAAAGDKQLAAAFKELGADVDRLNAKGRTSASVWTEITGRLAGVTSAAKRARLAMRLLGDQGAKVAMPSLGGGAAGLRAALSAARRAEAPKAATSAAVAQTSRLRAAYDRIRGAVRRATASYRDYRRAIVDQTRATRDAGDATTWWQRRLESARGSAGVMSGMLQAQFWIELARGILRASTALASFGARMAFAFGKKVFDVSTWTESLQKGLGMISGLGQRAGEFEFDRAVETARNLGLEVMGAVDQFKRLRGVGFSFQKSLDLTAMVADLQAGLGLTEETTQRIQLALGQIKGAGRLQGDELRQLQETGLSIDRVWQSISEQLGVSVQKAMKLKEAGKVSADVAIKAVEDATLATLGTSKLGEAAARLASETMAGRLRQAKASATKWLIDLGNTLRPKFDSLAQTIGRTFERFSKDGTLERVTDAIARVFGDLVDLIEIHWPRIERILRRGAQGGARGLGELSMSLDNMIDKFLSAVEWLQDNWEDVCSKAEWAAKGLAAAIGLIAVSSTINMMVTLAANIASIGSAAKKAVGGVRALAAALREKNAAEAGGALGGGKAAGGKAAGGALKKLLPAAGVAGGTAAAGAAIAFGTAKTVEHLQKTGQAPEQGFSPFYNPITAAYNTRMQAAANRAKDVVRVSREYSAPTTMPMIRGGAKAVTINDQRTTTVNVPASATPGQTGRAIGANIAQQQRTDRKALHSALAGAERG